MSLVASEKNPQKSPRATDTPQPSEQEMSRADAARALEGKDPSWFRQPTDRGVGSAAYRKNQDEESIRRGGSVKLPGMSRSLDKQEETPVKQLEDTDKRSSGESAAKSTFSSPQSSNTMTLSSRSKSPLPVLSSQRLEPSPGHENITLSRDGSPTRGLAMSPSQRSISPDRIERPASPTKGLGGFVQSAMLKRSDSINKHMRGNSQATSLSRSNSVLGSYEQVDTAKGRVEDDDGFLKPTLPNRSHSQIQEQTSDQNAADDNIPTTPSRTMDQRRWSPTKTTWLESAIQKTDSPKPKASPQKQPMWLSDLQKSKQSGISGTENKTSSHKTVEVGGFIRSPALGSPSKPTSTENIGPKSTDLSLDNHISANRARSTPATKENAGSVKEVGVESLTATSKPSPEETPQASPKSRTGNVSSPKPTVSARKPSASIKKPDTPPKKDFRSNLKSQESTKARATAEEPEFKNVFGKLKKTETKNYVAPDELKNSIMRGKAGLAITGGPRRYEKRDDLKDSILKKKEEMKTSGSVRGKPTPAPKPAASPVPEAIARQRGSVTKEASTEPEVEQSKAQAPQKQTSVQVETPKIAALEKKTSAPARLQVGAGGQGSNLADRFNPSLAGIIARGPSSMSSSGPPTRTESPMPIEDHARSDDASQSTHLNHATKSRARGPKRRLPQNSKVVDQAPVPETALEKGAPTAAKAVEDQAVVKPKPPDIITPKPIASTPTLSSDAQDSQTPRPSPRALPSPAKQDPYPATQGLSPTKLSPTLALKTPPTVKPKRVTSDAPSEVKKESTTAKDLLSSPRIPEERSLPPRSPKSPPVPATKSNALSKLTPNGASTPRVQELRSTPSVRPSSVASSQLWGNFFDDVEIPISKTSVDPTALLTGVLSGEGKIKTLRKEIWELTAGGKKEPLAPHQEHILFEDRIYLCKHVFGSASGKRTTEAYLWCGDQVSHSAIEDAQLFARNDARDAGGKLQILTQGKESSNFFEALGGIVITRRTSAPAYTLCGRRHMRYIAFDEVEHSTDSLCSGFPFIVSATDGTLYLWKGKGSNADELGCARLIAMDVGLTGEIEEIDEDNEPPAFFKTLKSSAKINPSAQHWSLKGSSEQYETRLFVVDTEARPKSSSSFTGLFTRRPSIPTNEDPSGQIKEISPYSQADIARDGICVLDAFFEIYM